MPADMNEMLLGDRFVLERELGSGGMARVFLGKDTVLDRPVAVKVLNPGHDDTDIGARFRREGRTAARLSHPNIVQVFDAGEAELDGKKVSYIVMEYVPGGDLKDLIAKRGTLPEEDLARLGAGAAAGLAHAHERGVIHRDVKPHNVLIDAYGEPKLTDFGIARALDSTTSNATRTGAYLGTALYSAPEQLQGQGVSPKSDVYSLGVTLYQAASGEVPFVGTPMEVAGQHIHRAPDPPEANGGELERLIMDCLAKDPSDRPTAKEAHDRLQGALNRLRERAVPPPQATPPEPETAPTRQAPPAVMAAQGTRRRRRGPILLGAVALLVALIGLAALAYTRGGEDPATSSNAPGNDGQTEAPAGNGGEDAPQNGGSQNSPSAGNASGNQNSGQGSGGQDAAQSGTQAEGGAPQAAPPQAAPPAGDGQGGDVGSGGESGLTEEAAARTVEQLYESADASDFDASYSLLSQGFRQREGLSSPDDWAPTFATLSSLRFVDGPTAQVSGDTATVTGVTIANLTDGTTQQNTGTWTLVDEGGEWKLDNLSLQQELI